jgi:hypothetical protein
MRLQSRAFLQARLEELVDEPPVRLAEAGLAPVAGKDVPEDHVRRAQRLAAMVTVAPPGTKDDTAATSTSW